MAELEIKTQVIEGVPEIWLHGELDSYSAPRVRLLLDALIDQAHPALLMNLTHLEYIDSCGLGVLVAALKQATDNAGSLVLVAPSPQVAHVLQVTGLDKVFTVSPGPVSAPVSA